MFKKRHHAWSEFTSSTLNLFAQIKSFFLFKCYSGPQAQATDTLQHEQRIESAILMDQTFQHSSIIFRMKTSAVWQGQRSRILETRSTKKYISTEGNRLLSLIWTENQVYYMALVSRILAFFKSDGTVAVILVESQIHLTF